MSGILSKKSLTWVKRGVMLVVLLALGSAVQKAMTRWDEQTAQIQLNAAELSVQASRATDQSERASLQRQHNEMLASIPSWHNCRLSDLGLAAFFYACGLLPPGRILHQSLNRVGVQCTLARATAAQLLGHAGKYIPGKAMVVVLRVSAVLQHDAKQESPQIGRAATCVFFETLLMMSVGGTIAGVLLWTTPLPAWIKWCALAMAFVAVIPTVPPVMQQALRFIARRRAAKKEVSASTNANRPAEEDEPAKESGTPSTSVQFDWTLLATGWLWSLLSWVLIGTSFAFLIRAIPSLQTIPDFVTLLPIATAAIALGMVLGFASLLPGGAGVREYVTLAVLTPVTGATHALLTVIAARLLFIAVESVMAGASHLFLRSSR